MATCRWKTRCQALKPNPYVSFFPTMVPLVGGGGGVALEGKGPQRWRLDRWLEEVAKPVAGGYCRLQMLLKLTLGVRETAAGYRLGARGVGGGSPPMHPWGGVGPPFQCIPGGGGGGVPGGM